MTFGMYLQKLRKREGLTQRALAAALDMDAAYLSRIENDIPNHLPNETTIRKIIVALGVVENDKECDSLYVLANKVPPDVKQMMMRDPRLFATVRQANGKKAHL